MSSNNKSFSSLGHCLWLTFSSIFIVILQHDVNNCLPCNCPRTTFYLFIGWKGAQRPHRCGDLKPRLVLASYFSGSSCERLRLCMTVLYVQLVCIKRMLNTKVEPRSGWMEPRVPLLIFARWSRLSCRRAMTRSHRYPISNILGRRQRSANDKRFSDS